MKILQFPLTRILIGLVTGIMAFRFINFSPTHILWVLSVCLFILLISYFYSGTNNLSKNIFGIFVFLASIFIGVSTALVHKENSNPYHYANQIRGDGKIANLDVLVSVKLKSTAKNHRYICEVTQLERYPSCGKVILNIRKKDSITKFQTGNHLHIIGNIYAHKNPQNPDVFDYGKYLENQEIYAQVYAKNIKVGTYEPGWWAAISNFREKIISNLERSGISKEELNVLNALILGQQQDISPEILKDYQYAGAVHILSVSGLHVGFIMLFIAFLLKPVGNSRKGSFFKLIVVVFSLWFFAILTGLSPSIVRSATMFSFVAVGLHLRRTVNVYHTLLASMLLILLFKPSFLFDVGFQLSYLALFFILWLQPVLSGIWVPKNKIVSYFWDIITVSFAAQIGAIPLSIYYFHQFPGLFFVTNLLILPLLGIIMAVGVLAILIAAFTEVPFFIAKSVEFLIVILNKIIHWVASIDAFVIRNISFSKEMLVGSYLAIFLIIIWIKRPKFGTMTFAFLSIILMQGIFIYQKKETLNKQELIVFSSRKTTIIAERIGSNVTIFSHDSILKALDGNLLVQSYLVGNFCHLKSKKPLQNLMYFKNKKILIIDSTCVYTKRIKPDILIIIQSPKLNMERLLKTFKPEEVVTDGSNYKSYIRLWEATCRKEKIPFHNINEKGFYKI